MSIYFPFIQIIHRNFFIRRLKYPRIWKLCNLFVYRNLLTEGNGRICFKLNKSGKVYAIKLLPSNYRVERKMHARMGTQIIERALQIREQNRMEKCREFSKNDNEHQHLMHRIDAMENTLRAIQDALEANYQKSNRK